MAMTRETTLRHRLALGAPDVTAEFYLYPTEGRRGPIALGWACPCSRDKEFSEGWDGYPLLESEMMPGERRTLGFVFLSGAEAASALTTNNPLFYLWEGKLIGEAKIIR
jgi:hypothetical protein